MIDRGRTTTESPRTGMSTYQHGTMWEKIVLEPNGYHIKTCLLKHVCGFQKIIDVPSLVVPLMTSLLIKDMNRLRQISDGDQTSRTWVFETHL